MHHKRTEQHKEIIEMNSNFLVSLAMNDTICCKAQPLPLQQTTLVVNLSVYVMRYPLHFALAIKPSVSSCTFYLLGLFIITFIQKRPLRASSLLQCRPDNKTMKANKTMH